MNTAKKEASVIIAYISAISLSSFLVFFIQPVLGRMILPYAGGAPSSWIVCMFFFQSLLLLGYLYAHTSLKILGMQRQMLLHALLFFGAVFFLPVSINEISKIPSVPTLWIIKSLILSAAVPYFVVSASAPMLQVWFASSSHSRSGNPYFLYAASNVGSIAALISYPFFIEPNLDVESQASLWTAVFLIMGFILLICAGNTSNNSITCESEKVNIDKNTSDRRDVFSAFRPGSSSKTDIGFWLIASFIPSSLMLGTTSFITRNIAPVPLLWIIPLFLYLVTFIVSFSGFLEKFPQIARRLATLAILLFLPFYFLKYLWPYALPINLFVLFAISLRCHEHLYLKRPQLKDLTLFYLIIAIGGAAGGFFNSIIAPAIFSSLAEYPLLIFISTVFMVQDFRRTNLKLDRKTRRIRYLTASLMGIIFPVLMLVLVRLELPVIIVVMSPIIVFLAVYNFFSFNISNFAFVAMTSLFLASFTSGELNIFRSRNFFGTKEVTIDSEGVKTLYNGATIHGVQAQEKSLVNEALSYYHRLGPLGDIFTSDIAASEDLKVAVVGMGVGSVTAYAREGQSFTFYEIDPEVVSIANDSKLFTYIENCRGNVQAVIGDGRLKIAETDKQFDLILIDAFSSAAIPVHMLTMEAIDIYLEKLSREGLLIFHISNSYLNLRPLMKSLAASSNLACIIGSDREFDPHSPENFKRFKSVYAVMSRKSEFLPNFIKEADSDNNAEDTVRNRWLEVNKIENMKSIEAWTDKHSSILSLY